jgi:hypothetical protein
LTDERPITPEQVRIAMTAAGLDPGRPLDDQLEPGAAPVNEDRLRALIAEEIAEALDRTERPETAGPPSAREQGEYMLRAIEASRTSRFHELGGEDDRGA